MTEMKKKERVSWDLPMGNSPRIKNRCDLCCMGLLAAANSVMCRDLSILYRMATNVHVFNNPTVPQHMITLSTLKLLLLSKHHKTLSFFCGPHQCGSGLFLASLSRSALAPTGWLTISSSSSARQASVRQTTSHVR